MTVTPASTTAPTAPTDEPEAGALLSRQTAILEQIAVGAPLRDVLYGIATTLEALVPDCCCSVLLLDRDAGILRHGAAPSLPADYLAGIDGMSIGPSAGSCGTAAFSGEPVVVEDIRDDVRWDGYRDGAERAGLRSCWSTPIHGRDGVSGTFAVYHPRPHLPSTREERLVGRLTHLASVAIDHAQVVGALAESEERFRRAFEDNAGGMALTTLDGVITRVNHAMRSLLDRPETELVGTSLDALFGVGTHESGLARYDAFEATVQSARGRTVDVAVALSTIRDGAGRPRALSVNVLDVTGRRVAERERARRVKAEIARQAAENANRAKSDFVAALGHELRTPLQAISGFTEVLGTLDLDVHRRSEALGHISAAADHILGIVGEVLDVARIEARALPLTLECVALAPLVDEVFAMVRPLAEAERVTLRATPPASPVHVHADERRLTQVLLNLVTNAIRYHRVDGNVVVTWGCAVPSDPRGEASGRRTSAASMVRVAVCDNGEGIAQEHFARLFTPFDRLGRSSDEGVGLGLPLARGLVEAMAGRLDVQSTVGQGTTVTLLLPASSDRTSTTGGFDHALT